MNRNTLPKLAAASAFAIAPLHAALGQSLPAFPGAEGFGAGATMRKNNLPFAGEVYHVTSLADTLTPGTLRYGVRESGFPANGRVIVFDVGGTINLTASLDIKNVNGLYIAGQTAPSPITLYGNTAQITSSSGKTTQNVMLRYLTFRKGTGSGEDAITFAGSGLGTNLILDHISGSWSEDEVLSVANNNTNVTVQYSMINDALVSSHAYGSLIRPQIDSSVTFHHNLYANNASRQARFGTYNAETLTADFRNNVIYNWRDRASYAGGSSEAEQESVDVNYVGNYLIAGPGTTGLANRAFTVDKNTDVRAYQSGNFIDPDRQLNPNGQPNGADTGWGMWGVNTPTDQTLTQMVSPFAMAPVATQSAIDAYNQVVNYVGNSWWNRDAIDARVINNVKTNTGPTIGAAAPPAAELNGVLNAPMTSRPAGWDTDNDGMPDAWELSHGLNPTVASPGDFDADGYSNVEEYLNEAGAFPAPRAIGWTGGTGRYALNGNWDTWQPSRFDVVNVNSGKATVDAVGQHAGMLNIGAAEVEVTAGWLDAAHSVNVHTGGTLRLGGGSVAIGSALNLGGGTLVLGGGTLALNAAGQFNIDGGTLRTTLNQSIGMNAVVGAAGATLDTTDRTINYSGTITGAGGFTKLGTGRLIASQLKVGGALAVNAGVMEISSNGGASGTVEASSLVVAPGASLNLHDNDLIVNYAGATSPEAAIRQRVRDGRAAGSTSGIFVTPGATADDVALAIVDNADWIKTSFNGIAIDATTVVGKYTYFGDANLDGQVTGDDYLAVDSNLGTGANWLEGDFNLDNAVTGDDYLAIDTNLGKGTANPLAYSELKAEMVAKHVAMFGEEYLVKLADVEANGFATVPEPGAMGLIGVAALGMRRRR